ncbi:MAG: phage tail tape measure protein, partial [Clostridia bacterium]|nr:phage tail tape measure protein [Clostridia bacterium]
MARNIKGITIEIDGKTTELQDSLSKVNEKLKQTQADLKDVNKLLKLDPTNTDLLKQKQGLLKSAISDVKEKLDKEKEALAQLEKADPSEKNTENMKVLQRQIADDEAELKKLTDQSKEFGSVFKQQAEAVGDKLKEVGAQVKEVGDNMTKNVTAPIMAGGAAAVAAFTDVDKAQDNLIKMTGASGDSLEEMKSIMEDIATSIPTDFGTAAAAVGEVSTRFGVTGDELEDLSTKFVKFANLNNSDVTTSVDTVQKAMAAWGMSAEEAGAFLDTLTKAAQDTGANATSLATVVADNTTVFDEMGFSVSDATMWLANLEKNGVDSSTAMGGLRKALQNASKEGISMDDALADLQTKLQNASSDTEAMNYVMDLFGTKAGPQLISALEEGRLSFEALGTSIEDNLGTVDETFQNTLSPTDEFKTTLNELKSVGAEVGGTILELLTPAIHAVADGIAAV